MFKGLRLYSFLIVLFLNSQILYALESIRSYEISAPPALLNQIAERFEIVKKLSSGYEVLVKEEDVADFIKIIPNARLLQKNTQAEFHSADKSVQRNLSSYRRYTDAEKDLMAFANNYKSIATLETYGTTKGGRKLYALKISSNKNLLSTKPEVMITAATHGDELVTVEVLFSLMNELLSGYGKDSRITKMIDGRDIYFVPVVSPDSFDARERYVQGMDPNRSYPWPEKINNKPVDCIEAMINFANSHRFAGSLDFHAYGKLVMFPWGYTTSSPPSKDEVILDDLVRTMARENQYTSGQISTTIYVAKGNSADYFYWKNKTKAIAAELSTQKVPPFSNIPKIVNEAREMTWAFIEHFN